MSKRTDYRLDLITATPAAIQGYILSAAFEDWLDGLDNDDLLLVERAFNNASVTAGNMRFARAHFHNQRISEAALAHGFGGGKSAVRGL